jgi:hypothetical protein
MSTKFIFLFFLIIFSSAKSDNTSLINYLKGFIQNYIDNDLLIKVIEFLRQRPHDFPDNLEKNKLAFQNHINRIKSNDGYIEDQSNYKDMSYGALPVSQNGCGVIAAYNVLYHLTKNEAIDFPAIIQELESDGIILNGAFGTSMIAIQDYFNKLGFKATGSSKVEDFDRIGFLNDATILTVFNNADDITDAMHYMAITKTNGIYKVHNNGYRDGAIKFTSINDVLKRINSGKAKGVYLIGISNN